MLSTTLDPSNRLVADELEAEWNHSIRAYNQAKTDYEHKREQDRLAITEEQTKRIHELVTHFPKLWSASSTNDQDRKRMIRLLIEDVTLIKAAHIEVKIRYKGGQTTEHSLPLPQSAWIEKKHSAEVLAAIDQLLDEHTDGEVHKFLTTRVIDREPVRPSVHVGFQLFAALIKYRAVLAGLKNVVC